MNKQEALEKACQVLRRRVRYDGASLRLPGNDFPFSGKSDDTKAIQEATRLYVESWIVPLIDSIESGDMTLVKKYCESELGHAMEQNHEAELANTIADANK